MKRLTLEEIGKLAEVSRATVSRVIHNHPNIKPDVRARVQKVIDETGYKPNLIARSLVSQRSNIIGLVVPSDVQKVFTDPYYPSLLQGIARACNENDLTFSLFLFHSKEEEDRILKSTMATGMVDGLIITVDYKDVEIIDQFKAKGMPFVTIGRPEHDDNVSYVDVDNIRGSYMATEHLIQLGYDSIATIASHQNTAGEDRLIGYQKALADHHIAYDENLVAYGDFSPDSGYLAMLKLLPQRPRAVFVASDTMALEAIQAIQDAGLRVPDDIALIGFDDLSPAMRATPPLTTIYQPIHDVCQRAVEKLIDISHNDDSKHEHIVLPTALVVRESCGAHLINA